LDEQARETLEIAIDENVNRGAGIEQNLQQLLLTNASFQRIPDLIDWTKSQVNGHELEVNFEGYVVRVNPESKQRCPRI